jgi:peptidoglycan/LPS O-acetylase OafA/YrhL
VETTAFRAPAPRLPGLDLVRAAAIAWVMLTHGEMFGLVSNDHWLVRYGWFGVDLFFVLSGFLIAGQLLRPFARGERPNYRRFFGRRLLRTLPAYLVVVVAYFAIPGVRDHPDIAPLWQFLTFTENVPPWPTPGLAFSHVWSLCVEEQFYLVFPAIVALIALKPSPSKVTLAIAFILTMGMVLRGYLWLRFVAETPFDTAADPHGPFMQLIYYPTDTRLDGLLMGIIAAAIQAFRPRAWVRLTARPNVLLVAGLAGVVASTLVFNHGQNARFWATVLGYPFLSFSVVLIVIAAATPSSLIGRHRVPGAGALAAGAYSLYLSHKVVFHWAQLARPHLPEWFQPFAFAPALLGAFALGAVLYWAVERPFLRLRDRLEGPSRSSLAVEATVGGALDR